MSSQANAVNPNPSFSETAEVRIASRRQWRQLDCKLAHVLISSRIYWKEADEHGTNKPQSFLDFRNEDSLVLSRLGDGKTWDDVREFVKEDNLNGRLRITICGRLRGRTRRSNPWLVGNVQVEMIANTAEQHEVWLNQIRSRIAPWKLLQEGVMSISNDVANDVLSPEVKELEKAFNGLPTGFYGTKPYSISKDEKEGTLLDFLGTLPKKMEKLSTAEKLTTHSAGIVGSGATLEAFVTRVESMAETAKLIGDASKVVAGVSSIFQLLVLGAQGVSLCAKAIHGRNVLPMTLERTRILLEYVMQSLLIIMKPSQDVSKLNLEFVFVTLRQALDTMDLAETQLWRRGISQVINADDVKEVEKKHGDVEHRAVTAGIISDVCTIRELANELKTEMVYELRKERERWNSEPHHVRPPLSAFFSGRTKELNTLRLVLEKCGSAVITQYGGVGKTELMIALADRAAQDEREPRDVFWVTVDDDKRGVIESLAGLVDKLTRRKMSEEARRNGNLVIAALKQVLDEREGQWLLCLDNADDGEVNGILNEVCGIAGETQGNGWVLVTSRQGKPHMWSRMKSEQRLVLKPLSAEDAMVTLWRQIRKIEMADVNDGAVMTEIKKLKREDQVEYQALKKLCGDNGGHGLGGLPLALVQAGSFIVQFDCSFAEYLDLFESANKEDWEDIMEKTEEVKPIQDSQRSIWTTWRISVEKLSPAALLSLGAIAMLGQGGVGEPTVTGILEAVAASRGVRVKGMFRRVIVKELMHGSSLVWQDEGEGGWNMYRMHRLVRLFILNDIGRESPIWSIVYSFALFAVIQSVETELEKEGKSFADLPDVFGNNHRELSVYSLALVHHYVLQAQSNARFDVSNVLAVHWYTGRVMGFMGKLEEESQVWEQFLDILHYQQAEPHHENGGKQVKNQIGAVYDSLESGLRAAVLPNRAILKLEEIVDMGRGAQGQVKLHSDIANSLANLGNAYLQMGKLEKALRTHEWSLKIHRAIHGLHAQHHDIATSLNNLGSVYQRNGELVKALETFVHSLNMYRAVHGHKPHHEIAKTLNNLGHLHHAMGSVEKAQENYEQSLEMYRAVHGCKPHHEIAKTLNNLGSTYQVMGMLEKALETFGQSLAIYQGVYGHKIPHRDVATCLSHLGNVYRGMGELNKALEMYNRSLDMFRVVHGHEPHLEIAKCLSNLGIVFEEMGELNNALEALSQSLGIYRAIHGPHAQHHDIAAVLNNLGSLYKVMGRLHVALETHKRSLEMFQKIYGHKTPHHDVALSLCNHGLVYQGKGELRKALEMYEQSLEMYRAVHGNNKPHDDIATCLNNLGSVYQAMGKLDKARKNYERSLEMHRKVHGQNKLHHYIARSLANIGSVYHASGNLHKALETYEQSLHMYRSVYGANNPHHDIAKCINNLGIVHQAMGKLDEALEMYEQSLEMYRAVHGHNEPHHAIAKSLNNLGFVYLAKGKLGKALKMHEESLEIYRAVHGHNKAHHDIAKTLNNLGDVHREEGEFSKALERYEQSLEIYRAVHGHNKLHHDIAKSLNNLGLAFYAMGKLDKALEKYKHCLEIYRAVHGHDKQHHEIANSHGNLGCVYRAMGELDKAQEMSQLSLEMYRAVYGHNNPHHDIALSLKSLGSVYYEKGKLDKAMESFVQGLNMYRDIYGQNKPHHDIAESLNNLGMVYRRKGELKKALETFIQSLEMYRTVHGHNKPRHDIATTLNNLGGVYYVTGKLDKALEACEQSIDMYRAVYGNDKPHHDSATCLSNLGDVYQEMGELNKAIEAYDQSLTMYRAVHGHNKPNYDIAETLFHLGTVYLRKNELDEALGVCKHSLNMYRAVHGHDKPHTDVAVSLGSIGIVHYKLKNLNRAAEFLEQSLEMLRILHSQNSPHPFSIGLEQCLAKVYQDLARRDDEFAIPERYIDADENKR